MVNNASPVVVVQSARLALPFDHQEAFGVARRATVRRSLRSVHTLERDHAAAVVVLVLLQHE